MAQLTAPAKHESQKSLFDDKIQYAANFLLEHYEIRVSVQDPSKKYIACKDADRKGIEPKFSEISLHLAANNVNVGDSMLRKILCSPYYIPHCDPIKDYFDSIRGTWDGKSQIDILCDHIKTRIFDENPAEFYITRTNNLFRKWLVSCVAMWLKNESNDVTLGLVQAVGGSGKTYLTRWLLPDVLKDYYIESSNNPKNFDIEDVYTRYMIINFEELVGLNKSTINTWKKVQTNTEIDIKQRGEEFPSKKTRIGCGVLSTNANEENGGFIQSWYGSDTRRLGLIEITELDQNYSNVIDKNQLWAEALTLLESSKFEYRFRQPDYEDFNTYNARYRFETDAMRVLQRSIRRPEADEEGEKLTPTQIMQRLDTLRKIKSDEMKNITPQKIGQALNALGYEQISYRSKADQNESRKGYHIVFITNEETNKKE